MPRYIVMRQKPRSWYDYGRDHEPFALPLGHPNVYEAGPIRTGLLDKDGNEIIRMPEEIGFVQRREAE